MAQLLEGNRRHAAGQPTFIHDHPAAIKKHEVAAQAPFAAVLSCADSRVPVELVSDQSGGRLFVARAAGNIAPPDVIASLKHGVAVPGTKAILVLGHANFNCGAVKTAMDRTAGPGQISGLYSFIQPAVDKAPPHDLVAAIKANACIQASLLRKALPVIAAAVHEDRLKVAAACYDLASGRARIPN